MEEEEQRSSFWSTVPGILTGVAAVISAATGGYLAFIRMPNAAASDSPHIAAAAELKPAAIAATPKEPSNSQEISRGTCHAKLFVQYASTRRGRCSARPTADFPEPSCDRRCRCHGNSVRGSAANHFFGPAKALFRLCPSLDAR